MKSIVICPSKRGTAALCPQKPLATLPLLGKTLLAHWLEHLANAGAKQVTILTSERDEQISREAGDGARWGLSLRVIISAGELPLEAVRKQYRPEAESDWLSGPDEIVYAHHLPGMPDQDLFCSYATFFAGLQAWLPQAVIGARAGFHEIRPGIWAGLRARISRGAELRAPLWIGEDVRVGNHACLGPNAIIEDRVLVGTGAEVSNSFIGVETFVGDATRVVDSLAFGNTLVNWRCNSMTKVPDPFLLCSLANEQPEQSSTLVLSPSMPSPAGSPNIQVPAAKLQRIGNS